MGVHEKLLNVRKSIDYLQKTESGNQGAKYVDPAVLVKKIRDRMDEHDLLLVPEMFEPTIDRIPMPTKNNSNAIGFLFKSKLIYTFIDIESGEKLEVPWYATGKHGQDPAMAGGAALTYFERYFLLKFFQIPTAKDDPEYFAHKTKEPERITVDQQAKVMELIEDTGSDEDAFLKFFGINAINQMIDTQFGKAMSMLKAKGAK